MALYRNTGTPVRDNDGNLIMRNEVFDSERIRKEMLVRRAHQFRAVQEAPEPPARRARVTNVPPKQTKPPYDDPKGDEPDGGPVEFDGTYDIDEMHTGSGWYTLPTGVRVRGRDAAEKALQELTGGD